MALTFASSFFYFFPIKKYLSTKSLYAVQFMDFINVISCINFYKYKIMALDNQIIKMHKKYAKVKYT